MRAALGALLLVSVYGPVQALERPLPVHGLWVWKSAAVLGAPQGPAELLRFCKSAGISEFHLDIEPQQRPESKGPGNLRFLDGLVAAYRDVAPLTRAAGLSLNADIQMKLLQGDLEQRRALLASTPRVTLMLYEISSSDDGTTAAQKEEKLRKRDRELLDAAYRGLADQGLARMAIALRTADYGSLLPAMLASLDAINGADPHYLGWARHSYNDLIAP